MIEVFGNFEEHESSCNLHKDMPLYLYRYIRNFRTWHVTIHLRRYKSSTLKQMRTNSRCTQMV